MQPLSDMTAETKQATDLSGRGALSFLVTLAMVALFADMVYEGARSLNGQFLSFLGASATAVGLVAGAGGRAAGLCPAFRFRLHLRQDP